MNGETKRRHKFVKIPNDLLADLLRLDGSRLVSIKGLPKDARLIRISSELYWDQDCTAIIFESSEFPELSSVQTTPELILEWNCEQLPPKE